MTQPLLQAADLRGAARLTTEAVAGLTSLVEAMHARIASLPQRPDRTAPEPDERTSGLTGLVYETVRGVTRVAMSMRAECTPSSFHGSTSSLPLDAGARITTGAPLVPRCVRASVRK